MTGLTRSMAVLGIFALGCSASGNSADPVQSNDASTAAVPQPLVSIAGDQFLTRPFQLMIDTDTLTASVDWPRTSEAQPPQAIYYDFDIANFLQPSSFVVSRVSIDGDNDIELEFLHEHPFAAPEFSSPISATNRADLGYTGRLLVLANGTTELFFDGTARTDPSLVKFPDGYLDPGTLLANDQFSLNNIYPYVLLADEAEDNRLGGPSNEGMPVGSYAPAFGGWQQANFSDGWTGFDFVHQGQSVLNTISFNKSALDAAGSVIDLTFLIKYTDPRGTGGPSLRMPVDPIDVTQFAYRLPFAALDNSKIGINDLFTPGGLGSTDDLGITIRDWDTRADASTDADLSDEPDVSLVQPGATGIPTVEFDAPAVASSPVTLTGLRGSGIPGDEMEFGADITNDQNPPGGRYHGLVRVTDKENALDRSGYHFGVDPDSLDASTSRALPLVTYQIVPYQVPGETASCIGGSAEWNGGAGLSGSDLFSDCLERAHLLQLGFWTGGESADVL